MAFWKRHQEPKVTQFARSLHEAVETNDCAAVKHFLQQGANPNAQDERGATGLHIAAAHGFMQIATLLLGSGADIDFLIQEGGTPLMAAAARLQPEMVEFLISKGAQPNKKGHDGRFPLVCPFHPGVVLVEKQLKCIGLLVDHGANVNEQTDSGTTPLMLAAWFGNREAAEELLRLGAARSVTDNRGRTAAMLAFERGHDTLAEILRSPTKDS